jgi:hypothetical protein
MSFAAVGVAQDCAVITRGESRAFLTGLATIGQMI